MSSQRTDTASYEASMSDILSQATAAMGDEEAYALAEDVDGLVVSNGTVDSFGGSPSSVTEDLARADIDHLGSAGQVALEGVASEYRGDIDAPQNIA